ncbi:MAG: hypothetical protein IT382_01835 [Deltaproteobacteria bacterium]|nr:hypothetical protein [Deltaproteobacteria bacterium]
MLRELRRARRGNPHTVEAVELRAAASRVLAAGLRLQLQEGRAVAVEGCGTARALWDDASGQWARGASALVVAQVDECGHRLCSRCAPRASRRNRRRILDRVALLDEVAKEAAGRTLAQSAQRQLDNEDEARDFLERTYAAVPLAERRFEVAAGLGAAAPTVYLDDNGTAHTAEATPLPSNHVACELANAYRHGEGRALVAAQLGYRLRVRRERIDEIERKDANAHRYAAGAWTLRARRAVERARAELQRACDREAAAALIADAESPRRRRAIAQAEAAALDLVAEAAWDMEAIGPPHLTAREAARAPAQVRHAEGPGPFAGRALAALQDAQAKGRARLQHAHESRALRRAVAAARAARDLHIERERLQVKARRAASLARLWRTRDVRFLTLTTKARPGESAAAGIERTSRALAKLTSSARWRAHVAGAILRIEVERSTPTTRRRVARCRLEEAAALADAGLTEDARRAEESAHALLRRERERRKARAPSSWWHPHVHVAAACGFWERSALLQLWQRACGDTAASVDIRRPSRGVRGTLDELTKYVTKPTGIGHLTPAEAADLAAGISRRNLLRCTGALRGLTIEDERKPMADLEGATGDGYRTPMGWVADPDSIAGVRGVYLTPDPDGSPRRVGRWRSDAEAQEAVRRAKEAAWDAHQQRRARGTTDDIPPT